ncbi:MAG: amino acid adenylation domain-containing protein [Acidobacteriota bacterium]
MTAKETIQHLLERSFEQFADRCALESSSRRIDYAELGAESSRLANLLRAEGARHGSIVAILVADTGTAITAMIGTLRAGAAFVMLDPALPDRRLATLAQQVEPGWLLADAASLQFAGRLRASHAPAARLVALDGDPTSVSEDCLDFATFDDRRPPRLDYGRDDLSYVYFTSGSSGQPKGIAGRLKAIDHFIRWEIDTLSLDQGVRASQLVAPSFDAFLRDVLVPLVAGGTVCIPPSREVVGDPGLLSAWLDERRIELVHGTPSLLRTLLQEPLDSGRFAALKHLLLAGEALLPADIRRWQAIFGDRVVLFNLYGPSETTMTKLFYRVRPGDGERRMIPIGKPMRGARAVVLDDDGKPCPPGFAGEIYLRTPFRSLGYYQQPDLTSAAFVVNPLNNDPNDLLYRTGDLGRRLEDGNFEFLGRRDHQVKIRGVRVELGEVENALSEHPSVAEVAVIAREQADATRYLCAYAVTRDSLEPSALRRWASERLPEALVPSRIEVIETMPRTATGKVDRGALAQRPDSEAEAQEAGSQRTERGPTEELLTGIWSEVLGCERVEPQDDFFQLGGHSLTAMQVRARVRAAFGVDLSLRRFFEQPTLAAMATAIEDGRRSAAGLPTAPIVAVARDNELPASFAQQRLWFLDQLGAAQSAYHLSASVAANGDLDPGILRRSFAALTARHEALRTRFVEHDGQPRQVIADAEAPALPIVDLTALPPATRAVESTRLARFEADHPFDLTRGPLLRTTLLRLDRHRHVLLVTLHHICGDEWSMGVLMREVATLYRDLAAGVQPTLLALPVQYPDYAVWQQHALAGEKLERRLETWRQRLAGAPVLELPLDRPRPQVRNLRGAALHAALPKASRAELEAFGRRQGATLFMTLAATFNLLLARYSGQRDVLIGTPVANRERVETEGLIGFFVNTLVLRTDLAGDPPFEQLLGQVRANILESFLDQDLPFDKLVEALQPARSLNRNPLFDVMLILRNAPMPEIELPGLELRQLPVADNAAKFDFSLSLSEIPDGLGVSLTYSTDLFDTTTIERLSRHLRRLLVAVSVAPERRLSAFALTSDAERHQMLHEWNETARKWPGSPCVHRWIEQIAERLPEATAAVFDDQHLSYRELDRRSHRLAQRLLSQGTRPDEVVAVMMERSLELVVALFGVLKAGAAFVPLDPDYPRPRLEFMLADAGCRIVLTQERFRSALEQGPARPLCLDTSWAGDATGSMASPPASVEGSQTAYVLYTSGSTGWPKGVMVPHVGIVNRLHWMQGIYPLGPGDRVLQKTPSSFDVSMWELFGPLIAGACLVLARPGGHRDSGYLARTITEHRVSALHFVPSMLRVFLEEPALSIGHRPLVLCGGEALTPALARRFRQRIDGARLVNLYGPTEASVDATSWPCPTDLLTERVPIGRPVDNLHLYVLDRNLTPLTVGAPGELHIAGVGLARGYLGRPGLTASTFVPDAFAATDSIVSAAGARLYRTGDQVRLLPGGEIEFLGRFDDQVKVRGFRIELEEIESVLGRHPQVRQAAVAVSPTPDGASRLVAYYVRRNGATDPLDNTLRGYLRTELPEHLVPALYVTLDALPLTPSGKLDRRALPRPDGVRPAIEGPSVAPRNAAEEVVAGIWSEVLEIDDVGVEDNFFDLGGHSLMATRVVSRLRDALDPELELQEFFVAATVGRLVETMSRDPQRRQRVEQTAEVLLTLAQLSDDEVEAMLGS